MAAGNQFDRFSQLRGLQSLHAEDPCWNLYEAGPHGILRKHQCFATSEWQRGETTVKALFEYPNKDECVGLSLGNWKQDFSFGAKVHSEEANYTFVRYCRHRVQISAADPMSESQVHESISSFQAYYLGALEVLGF